ncbi:MAG TPA: hypothetical protein VNU24_08165, partial [Solirubrobacteraceae bacterium]|nr:hypothetical protein [Solirubrobacteraceae bacterium]
AAECTVLGIKATDTCTSNGGKILLANTEAGLVDGEFMEEATKEEESACTIGGKEAGLTFGLLLFRTVEGKALSVAQGPAPAFEGPSWWIKGSRAGMGVEKTVSTVSSTAISILFGTGGSQEFKCTKFDYLGKIVGSAAERVGTGTGTIAFSECVDETEKGCEIYSLQKEGSELSAKGSIGPMAVEATLAFAANVRIDAVVVFTSLELNVREELTFAVLLIEKKSGEACTLASAEGLEVTGKVAAVLENPATNTPIGSKTELTKVQLGLVATEVEEWNPTAKRYNRPTRARLAFSLSPFVPAGSAVMELNLPEAFGWVNK